jgi:hypothetical protein
VLATINTTDFLYTCPGHLNDPSFASQLVDSGDGIVAAQKAAISADEIAKVKEEWEERQKKKQEKEKAKAAEKEKEKDSEKEDKDKKTINSKITTPSPLPAAAPTPPKPTHQKYALHRDFYAMRLSEHRKRRQVAQAKELAPRLPGAPRGLLLNNEYLNFEGQCPALRRPFGFRCVAVTSRGCSQ